MSGQPIISAVMPARNVAPFIGAAVESVLRQTLTAWELLVVDDQSTDDTVRVVERYLDDPRVRLIRLEANRGRGGARNAALAHARGRYIAPCDADDISLPERFERQAAYLDAHSEVDVVSAQMLYFWGDAPPRTRVMYPEAPEDIERRFARGQMGLSHPASIVRAECFHRCGGYREDLPRAEDFELFLRFRRACTFRVLPDVLYLYRHEVGRVSLRKWMETACCRQYAVYLSGGAAGTYPPAPEPFADFARRWSTRAGLYPVELARYAVYTLRAWLRPVHALR